ncbi:DUF4344 domain-containing metallopeptidase [Aeromicrobium sp. Root472D3]|uniref:DUF4344 domain-containing metallopeptidase n=1 Tax=Aeromicrobium sp. Root472D3 TaxID=1736540 RepID=UPI0009EC7A0A|nr:DUF4344 domain-containing metallopeptidase [Aeromicrobium sp. Root472D3]
MSWVRRGAVVLVPLVLSGCVVLGGAGGDGAGPGGGAFVVTYEEPDDRDLRSVAAEVEDGGVVEEAVEGLNDFVVLPVDVPVVVRSCADGALYDPARREIQVCLEDVVETRELLEDADDAAATERGILVDTVDHEAGHALLDVYEMEFTGREEDVADQFSALVGVRGGDQGLDDLEAAAYGYELSAAAYEADPTDEHASDTQRAVTYQCYVYGSEGRDADHLVDEDGLTERRAESCWEEWGDLQEGWMRLLRRADALR